MYFDHSGRLVNPVEPINSEWPTPSHFPFTRILYYLVRHYHSPQVLDFIPSPFFQYDVINEYIYAFSEDYGYLFAKSMEQDEIELEPKLETNIEPNLFIDLREEETDDNCPPLIGRGGRALTLRTPFTTSVFDDLLMAQLEQYSNNLIKSTITRGDLEALRDKYQIPQTITLRPPQLIEYTCTYVRDEVCLYLGAFEGGLCLPFPRIVKEVLEFFGLAPAQIASNSWRHLIGCAVLWQAMSNGGSHLMVEAFIFLY